MSGGNHRASDVIHMHVLTVGHLNFIGLYHVPRQRDFCQRGSTSGPGRRWDFQLDGTATAFVTYSHSNRAAPTCRLATVIVKS